MIAGLLSIIRWRWRFARIIHTRFHWSDVLSHFCVCAWSSVDSFAYQVDSSSWKSNTFQWAGHIEVTIHFIQHWNGECSCTHIINNFHFFFDYKIVTFHPHKQTLIYIIECGFAGRSTKISNSSNKFPKK